MDFSERHSEEVMFLLTLSVHIRNISHGQFGSTWSKTECAPCAYACVTKIAVKGIKAKDTSSDSLPDVTHQAMTDQVQILFWVDLQQDHLVVVVVVVVGVL